MRRASAAWLLLALLALSACAQARPCHAARARTAPLLGRPRSKPVPPR